MYEGQYVRLRAFDNGDLMKSLSYVNDYEIMRGAYSGILYPSTVEDEAQYLSGQTSRSQGAYQFAIETLEDHAFIGKCGFTAISWKNRLGEIAIMIGDPAMHGKGYGTDAVKLLCDLGFDEMNLHKIKVEVLVFNQAALRCYEKCGFIREGTLRDQVFREGKYHDVIVMGRINPREVQP